MTTTSSTPALGGTITSLRPFDGLFLRAEHLEGIQGYARALSRALGTAGGMGVVHGYTVRLKDTTLNVGPGLAIDPAGRPLLLERQATVPLPDPDTSPSGLWVIELFATDWLFGDEEVYGRLCDDPCGDGTSARPFLAEGLDIRFRPDILSGIAGVGSDELRSAAASAWFERERQDGQSLLATSERDAASVTKLGDDRWRTGTDGPSGNSVAIGLLLHSSQGWDVDIWTARRDRIDPPPRRGWQWRMGMRPWDVFLAQILQFHAQLVDLGMPPFGSGVLPVVEKRQFAQVLHEAAEETLKGSRKVAADRIADLAQSLIQGTASTATQGVLRASGLVELPPAGFLPFNPSGELTVEDYIEQLFGSTVHLRFCTCRPDFVAHAVEEAQHQDRISLCGNDPLPDVDILVPGGNWVAFHRRRDRHCPVAEHVEVFGIAATLVRERYYLLVQTLLEGMVVPANWLGTLEFPAGAANINTDDVPAAVSDIFADADLATVVALSPTSADLPLVHDRAKALIDAISPPAQPDLRALVTGDVGRPAIYIVVQRPDGDGDNGDDGVDATDGSSPSPEPIPGPSPTPEPAPEPEAPVQPPTPAAAQTVTVEETAPKKAEPARTRARRTSPRQRPSTRPNDETDSGPE